jgi:nitrite reductase/ring-hydroxylating ferredoxin subunit/DMSO/TMAO reductase YedYZ heme-binding membrane subunit
MFFLALTSWDWMQKHVGNTRWKKIHFVVMVLYAAILGYAIWVNVSNGLAIAPAYWFVFAAFFAFWFVVAPWGLAPRIIKFLNGWKQLHVLIHIAYASLVLHVWFGVAFAQPLWVKAIFFSLVGVTWGSHLAGWIIKWREDRRLQAQAAQSKQIQVEGKPYWSVGRAEDFVEGKGRKFLINKLPIAVFNYQQKFFGLFAVCAHQKGPIEKGEIVNGYVECPWHHWQYSCESGVGPPGFPDRLAYYPCLVQNGVVYVSAFPKRAERAEGPV